MVVAQTSVLIHNIFDGLIWYKIKELFREPLNINNNVAHFAEF